MPGNKRFREEFVALNQSRGSYPLVYIATLNFVFKIICINISYSIKFSSELCKLFHNVCTTHVYHANVYKFAQHYACAYTVKLYLFSQAIIRRFSGGHYHHQGWKHPRPKNAALARCPSCHTSLYFAPPFNTELFMSHFPRVSFVHTQWNRNFITSIKGCKLKSFLNAGLCTM